MSQVDNTVLPSGSGGDTIRDVDRGGAQGGTSVKTQVVQLDVGGPAAAPESLVSQVNPLPVRGANIENLLAQILACSRAQVFILNHITGQAVNPSDFMDDSTLQ